ncbi:MAG: hypothetical protein JO323_10810 [Acidobacteriia bacterium]|nr:hypothetical protein [Terriglobia bacterium]
MKSARRRLEVDLEELDRVLDGARQSPLSAADHDKLKDALHAMAALLTRSRNTEKTSAVVEPTSEEPGQQNARRRPDMGGTARRRSPAQARWRFRTRTSNTAIAARNADRAMSTCRRNRGFCAHRGAGAAGGDGVFAGAVTVWRLRASFHGGRAGRRGGGEVRRDGGGDDRATEVRQRDPVLPAGAAGEQLGIPLPAATQWEIVEEEAEVIKPARDELIRQAANGEVLHNDDTGCGC